jgi:hypothetical protein
LSARLADNLYIQPEHLAVRGPLAQGIPGLLSFAPEDRGVYQVRLALMILCHDGKAEVVRTLELPFPPSAGLILDFEDDGDCAHVASVVWSVPGNCFQVQCQPYDECDLSPEDQTGVHEWLAHYLSLGWQISLAPETTQAAKESARQAARADAPRRRRPRG